MSACIFASGFCYIRRTNAQAQASGTHTNTHDSIWLQRVRVHVLDILQPHTPLVWFAHSCYSFAICCFRKMMKANNTALVVDRASLDNQAIRMDNQTEPERNGWRKKIRQILLCAKHSPIGFNLISCALNSPILDSTFLTMLQKQNGKKERHKLLSELFKK